MYIDDFSPGLGPEDSVAVQQAGRRAGWLMQGGCGKGFSGAICHLEKM